MVSVFDTAKYILTKIGPISAMKLQKLVYYSQAWALAWDDKPIFQESIEAWANGPVVRRLYEAHKGKFIVNAEDFPDADTCRLSEEHKETINSVIDAYGKKSAQWLSDQTHSEQPWLEARRGLDDSERGNREITLEAMAEYYSSLR